MTPPSPLPDVIWDIVLQYLIVDGGVLEEMYNRDVSRLSPPSHLPGVIWDMYIVLQYLNVTPNMQVTFKMTPTREITEDITNMLLHEVDEFAIMVAGWTRLNLPCKEPIPQFLEEYTIN